MGLPGHTPGESFLELNGRHPGSGMPGGGDMAEIATLEIF